MLNDPFVLVSSPGMHEITERIQAILNDKGSSFPHYKIEETHFSNGEYLPEIPGTVRRQGIFLLHPMQNPSPNDAVFRMHIINDALMRAAASEINLVLPHMSYLRQDRRCKSKKPHCGYRQPISAKALVKTIESNATVKRVITVDMHNEAEVGFFDIPVDNLSTQKLFGKYLKDLFKGDSSSLHVVAPDFGAANRVYEFTKKLDAIFKKEAGNIPISIIQKRRPGPNEAKVASIVGDPIEGKDVIVYDDMIDSGGTMRVTCEELKKQGAQSIRICATHGIFSGKATENFATADIPVITTDSIPRDAMYYDERPWLSCLSLDEILAKAIYVQSRVGDSMNELIT